MSTGGSRSKAVAVGGVILICAQMFIMLMQVVYSAVTSRVLAPEDFGHFTVALAAMGLVTLVLTSGLPTAVLAIPVFSRSDVSVLTTASIMAALGAAALLWYLAPVWTLLWSSPGALQLIQILVLNAVVATPGAVQLALLRREGRYIADASVQVISALIGMILGVIAVISYGKPWALAISPISTSIIVLVLSYTARRTRYDFSKPVGWRRSVVFSGNVSLQSFGFWVTTTIPIWAISVGLSADMLGQYSRAAVLASLPATALAAALVRGLQPYYRHLHDRGSQRRAIGDVAVLAVAIAAPIFSFISLYSSDIILVWLGPGWDKAATITHYLAVGTGTYLVFTVITNAAETLGQFSSVRRAQALMILMAAVFGSCAILYKQIIIASVALLAIAASGMYMILRGLKKVGLFEPSTQRPRLLRQFAWSLIPIAAAGLGSNLIVSIFLDKESVFQSIVSLGSAAALAGIVAALVFKHQPVWAVLSERKIVGRQ